MAIATFHAGTVPANGTELYYEMRGRGPGLLLITGATGDAGFFTEAAERLSADFTVVTYDRRGYSRSPRPAGWARTTIAEQAADAAALVQALEVAPVVAFGTSGGGAIGAELMLRYPAPLRAIILHEPTLIAPILSAEEARALLGPIVGPAMAQRGPRAALESFLRHFVGTNNVDHMESAFRERVLGNADAFFTIELASILDYAPAPADLVATRVPLRIAMSAASVPEATGGGKWLLDLLHVDAATFAGGHAPYLDDPSRFAETLHRTIDEVVA